jgi:hypothetical protein
MNQTTHLAQYGLYVGSSGISMALVKFRETLNALRNFNLMELGIAVETAKSSFSFLAAADTLPFCDTFFTIRANIKLPELK